MRPEIKAQINHTRKSYRFKCVNPLCTAPFLFSKVNCALLYVYLAQSIKLKTFNSDIWMTGGEKRMNKLSCTWQRAHRFLVRDNDNDNGNCINGHRSFLLRRCYRCSVSCYLYWWNFVFVSITHSGKKSDFCLIKYESGEKGGDRQNRMHVFGHLPFSSLAREWELLLLFFVAFYFDVKLLNT